MSTEQDFGTITFFNKEIVIGQLPYISDNGLYYRATGFDGEGNSYQIEWAVINFDTEDESEACDWNKFSIRTTIPTDLIEIIRKG